MPQQEETRVASLSAEPMTTERAEEITPGVETKKETPNTPEQPEAASLSPEKKEGAVERAVYTLKHAVGKKPKKTLADVAPRDELTIRVEKIMEEHLQDAYAALSPIQRQEFKIAGEKTASQIRQLLKKTHVKIKKIIRLLLSWLKLLPGVNRYFLEQEAKIKADKILALKYRTEE